MGTRGVNENRGLAPIKPEGPPGRRSLLGPASAPARVLFEYHPRNLTQHFSLALLIRRVRGGGSAARVAALFVRRASSGCCTLPEGNEPR
jgi:hypothetical protein